MAEARAMPVQAVIPTTPQRGGGGISQAGTDDVSSTLFSIPHSAFDILHFGFRAPGKTEITNDE
jgi:hypothetical protein